MTNRKASVTQAELARYAKALRSAGIDEWRIEIERDGAKVSIVAGKVSEAAAATEDFDELIARIPDAAA